MVFPIPSFLVHLPKSILIRELVSVTEGHSLNLNHCVIVSQGNFTLNLKAESTMNGLSCVVHTYSIKQQVGKGCGKHDNPDIPETKEHMQCKRSALHKLGLLYSNLFLKQKKVILYSA